MWKCACESLIQIVHTKYVSVEHLALGYKTRKTKNRTNKFIVKRRNSK